MEVLRPGDAAEFLRLAGALLERDEARNQLPLGIAGNLMERPDAFDVVRFWVVREGDEPVAAAVRTEPFNLVLGDPSSEATLDPLLEAVVADDSEVPGIVGNVPFVEPAAKRLAGASGRSAERILSQGVYGLTAVRDVSRAPGEPKLLKNAASGRRGSRGRHSLRGRRSRRPPDARPNHTGTGRAARAGTG